MPETMIGNYRIDKKIGAGGMGDVFLGVDVMLEREVAIKSLLPELSRREDLIGRFRSEAVAMGRLNHPNIAMVYNFLLHDQRYYLIMEFVHGQPLDKILEKRGALPWKDALPLLCRVLDGLSHAHGLGIVHRDIKPANLMITPEGSVKLMDFGIARILQNARQTRSGHMVGTLEYMSPEHIQGRETDARTDIYSVGIVAYEMLTGNLPFRKNTDYEIIKAQVEEAPRAIRSFRPDLPEVVEKVVLKALEKSAEARFSSAAAFREALEQAFTAAAGTSMPQTVTGLIAQAGQQAAPVQGRKPVAPASSGSGDALGKKYAIAQDTGDKKLVRALAYGFAALVVICAGVLYWVFNGSSSSRPQTAFDDTVKSSAPAEKPKTPERQPTPLPLNELRTQAEAGDTAAQYELGVRYLLGQDVPKDLSLAETWLTRAAQAGYTRAAYQLGICFDTQKRYDEALSWFLKSDQEGDKRAAPEIGLEYAQKGDFKSALPWLRKGAEANHGRAQFTLGMIAYNGLAGDKDFDSAKRHFEQAAQQNVAEAQFMLGVMAELGQGMDKDLQAAQRWLKAAEANKYAAATKELKRVRKLLGGE